MLPLKTGLIQDIGHIPPYWPYRAGIWPRRARVLDPIYFVFLSTPSMPIFEKNGGTGVEYFHFGVHFLTKLEKLCSVL